MGDLPAGPEAQLLLAIIWQAMQDCDKDEMARNWFLTPHPACRAYCYLLNLPLERVQAYVRDRFGVAA